MHAFQYALGWVAGIMGAIFLLMSALPRRSAQHMEGAGAEPAVAEREPELVA
ncbi:hypothetical protein [Streptomyces puniciscabiei]|uniref:hypothetical protein n=1 Tax=Streptomyces puniciscabiei TaxID=164348 RepID=UPI000A690FA7